MRSLGDERFGTMKLKGSSAASTQLHQRARSSPPGSIEMPSELPRSDPTSRLWPELGRSRSGFCSIASAVIPASPTRPRMDHSSDREVVMTFLMLVLVIAGPSLVGSLAIQVSKLFQRMSGSKADKVTMCTPTNSAILAII